jgi:uncharacterized protein YndB with AHSA1/START domain
MASATDRIEKQVVLRAPQSRVWRAVTDFKEFGTWFRVKLESAFAVGKTVAGMVTYPGYEHIKFSVEVERMEPETLFSFRWHPYPADPKQDYSEEPTTLIEFRLEAVPEGTRLKVVESGFDQIPASRRDEAFRMNSQGWATQMDNIKRHVEV